jgi:hypothetical protein
VGEEEAKIDNVIFDALKKIPMCDSMELFMLASFIIS